MTDREADHGSPALTPEATAALLHLLVADSRRIARAEVDGRVVWIKRFDTEARNWARRLHGRLSALAPVPFLRNCPVLPATGQIDREVRKMMAFGRAGFCVPDIVFRSERALVLSDVVTIVQKRLNALRHDQAEEAHDNLLVGCAEALAAAHRSGLCHGRPHPRDMVKAGEQWGFIDFEEEPEKVMPLTTAQARDVWLLFLQICTQARRRQTPEDALTTYLAAAPAGVNAELATIVRTLSPLLPILRMLDHGLLGKDGQRVLKATEFLRYALPRGEAARKAHAAAARHDTATG